MKRDRGEGEEGLDEGGSVDRLPQITDRGPQFRVQVGTGSVPKPDP